MVAAPALARTGTSRRWRMATSWQSNLPGPGVSAERLARRITAMSNGELTIEPFGAGQIVPALQVFDAVSTGTVEMGHSASLFSVGKMPAAAIFTTVPFGLGPVEHAGWIDQGGQALWDELYRPFNVLAFLAGNTGPSTAGWFRKPLRSSADISGLRIRVTGLGGDLYRRLGATPLAISPGETYQALESGVIDAAEFLAPANDGSMGLHRVAPLLAYPGFNKPNGASEALIHRVAWEGLPAHLREIIRIACRAEHDQGLAEAESANAIALRKLLMEGAQLMPLPRDLVARAQTATDDILSEIRDRDGLSTRIVNSYLAARESGLAWRRVQTVLR